MLPRRVAEQQLRRGSWYEKAMARRRVNDSDKRDELATENQMTDEFAVSRNR